MAVRLAQSLSRISIQLAARWCSARRAYLTNVHGTLFFAADDGVTGFELWKSDGSEAGTVRVADIASNSVGPTALDSTLIARSGTTVQGVLHAANFDAVPLTYSLVANSSQGQVTLANAATGAFSYSAAIGATGSDSFTFMVSDGKHAPQSATVHVLLGTTIVYLPTVRQEE